MSALETVYFEPLSANGATVKQREAFRAVLGRDLLVNITRVGINSSGYVILEFCPRVKIVAAGPYWDVSDEPKLEYVFKAAARCKEMELLEYEGFWTEEAVQCKWQVIDLLTPEFDV